MTTTQRRSPVPGMRRGVLVAGVAGTVLITAAGAIARGSDGALSALAGALLAFVVILVGLFGIQLVLVGDPGGAMAGAGVVYLGQLILLTGAILVLKDADWLDGPAAAVGAVTATILLQIGQLIGYVRARHEIYPQGGHA